MILAFIFFVFLKVLQQLKEEKAKLKDQEEVTCILLVYVACVVERWFCRISALACAEKKKDHVQRYARLDGELTYA